MPLPPNQQCDHAKCAPYNRQFHQWSSCYHNPANDRRTKADAQRVFLQAKRLLLSMSKEDKEKAMTQQEADLIEYED